MSFESSSISSTTYNLIKRGLDASSIRGKVISNNMANINTKGFKRSFVTFEENLQENVDKFSLKLEDEKHMDLQGKKGDITVEKDESTSMKADGNNVDLDIEKANQAANTLMYNALISSLNNRISTKRYIINGR